MAGTVIDRWTRSLSSTDRYRKADAAIKLGQHGASQALPALSSLVDDDDSIVALSAIYASWKLGEDRIGVDRILAAVRSGNEEETQQAVEIAAAIGPQLVPGIEPLLEQERSTAKLALRLLEEIGGSAALRAIRDMQNRDPEVSMLAAEILDDWDDESELRVRLATESDIETLVDIENACFAERPSKDHRFDDRQYRYYIRNENAIVLIASRDGEVVGSAIALAGSGARSASGRVLSIAVVSHARRQGIGSELLSRMIANLSVRGCQRIYLEVADDAEDAKRLFESHEFQAVRKLPDFYGPSMHATRMKLTADPVSETGALSQSL